MKTRVWLGAVAGAAVLGLGALAFNWRPATVSVPTTHVKKGNLAIEIYVTGELKPSKSAMLLAPPVGGNLQILTLKASGTRVEAKDVVVEFDPTEQEFSVEQAKSEVGEVDQQIAKERADIAIQGAQDQVGLIQARFELRKAELDSERNELLAPIDARKNVLALEESKRRLDQLQQDILSRATSGKAKLAVLTEKRQKARLKQTQAEKAMEEMRITSPVPGFVAILENRSLDFNQPGMSLPEYRTGDLVSSGQPIAQVAQPESMEIITKVDEADRANVEAGQVVEVYCEGLPPDVVLAGKVKRVASVPARGNWWQTGNKKFDMVVEMTQHDPRLRSGQTARVLVRAKELKDVLRVPRQAVFDKEGKSLVYARSGAGFEPREIKIVQRSESAVAIEGVKEGTEVALADPEGAAGSGRAKTESSGPMTGGTR